MTTRTWTTLTILAIAAGLLSAGVSFAEDTPTAKPKAKPDPMTQPDETWISISGTVKSVTPDTFKLDYGEGMITVEMDDGDRDADAYALLPDDKVTVSGMIDADFLQKRTIEASSVYVEKLGTYFYASALDEEDPYFVAVSVPVIVSTTLVRGEVTSVSEDAFVLDTGTQALRVEVDEMPYDPLDDKGYQKIRKGQRVSVSGHIDNDLFEGRALDAHSIVTLSKRTPSETSTQ